jgi:hypothetical protein
MPLPQTKNCILSGWTPLRPSYKTKLTGIIPLLIHHDFDHNVFMEPDEKQFTRRLNNLTRLGLMVANKVSLTIEKKYGAANSITPLMQKIPSIQRTLLDPRRRIQEKKLSLMETKSTAPKRRRLRYMQPRPTRTPCSFHGSIWTNPIPIMHYCGFRSAQWRCLWGI